MRRYVEWDSPWMADTSQAGGGALLNLGGHGFDMARFLTGEEPEVVSAVISRRVQGGEVEDYALATLRTPSGILFHNEVGYTMPTWPANQTDGEQKVAGERLLLRQAPGGLQLIGPGRDEFLPQPDGWQAGYPLAVREALEAYGRGDPPPIPASECAHAVRLIFESYRAAAVGRTQRPSGTRAFDQFTHQPLAEAHGAEQVVVSPLSGAKTTYCARRREMSIKLSAPPFHVSVQTSDYEVHPDPAVANQSVCVKAKPRTPNAERGQCHGVKSADYEFQISRGSTRSKRPKLTSVTSVSPLLGLLLSGASHARCQCSNVPQNGVDE